MTQTPIDPASESPADSGRLFLDTDQPLVPALAAAFRSVLDYAREMAARVETDTIMAVHGYRKALRRARSVLRMLRPALPDPARRELDDELRELARATSMVRDADVLIDICASLAVEGPVGDTLALVGEQVASHRAELLATGRAAGLLAIGATRLAELPDVLDGLVQHDTTPTALSSAFERAWQRALRARQRALALGTDDATHTWRKRIKEVRYQLELLSEPIGGPVDGLRQVYAALAKRLGDITDLVALRRYLAAHTEGIAPDAASALDLHLENLIDWERRVAADESVEVRERIALLASGPPPAAPEGESG